VARITVAMARAWAEGTKLVIDALDLDLLDHIENEVVARLNSIENTSTWIDSATTPPLVRTIITKLYVAWIYDRQYSEDIEEGSNYAERLRANAEALMLGLLDGTIELPGSTSETESPIFYPTDASSAQEPTFEDPSLGPATFSMGLRF
jgi:hypothetical protein